jgi:hypothetical protein
LLPGCGTAPSRPAAASHATPEPGGAIVARGDWDDLPAAIVAAASRHELAQTGSESPEAGVRRFTLVSVRSEPIEVVARRVGGTPGEEPALELTGSWGRFPDTYESRDRLARLLKSVADRLGQLNGVDVAPIRWTSRGP